jgi:endogenous inhibitor of DNA gyrase (YacG/DUF329 family)
MQKENMARYDPFCSYQCQKFWALEETQRYLIEQRTKREMT